MASKRKNVEFFRHEVDFDEYFAALMVFDRKRSGVPLVKHRQLSGKKPVAYAEFNWKMVGLETFNRRKTASKAPKHKKRESFLKKTGF